MMIIILKKMKEPFTRENGIIIDNLMNDISEFNSNENIVILHH